MSGTYKSEACAVVHEIAGGLHEDGIIDEAKMREFDALCLAPAQELTEQPAGSPVRAKRNRDTVPLDL